MPRKQPAAQEGVHGDLVGGVEHARRGAAGHARPRAPGAGTGSVARRAARRSASRPRPGRARAPARRRARGGAARRRSAPACPGARGAPAPRRRKRAPGVDDRLRVHDDVDPVVRRAEEVVGLDHLEALVHQRRRVDRDLAAHRPRRVLRAPRSTVTPSSSAARAAAERPAGRGQRRAGRPCPARSPAISWCSAECSESTGMSCAPVASASAVTSSPPTTSDSLLASARSIPSSAPTTSGPRPAEPTIALRTRSAPDSATSSHQALGPGEHLAVGPRLGRPRGGVGVGQRDPAHAVRARLRDERLVRGARGQADELEARRADDVERLRADRAGRAEDEEPLHRRPIVADELP